MPVNSLPRFSDLLLCASTPILHRASPSGPPSSHVRLGFLIRNRHALQVDLARPRNAGCRKRCP